MKQEPNSRRAAHADAREGIPASSGRGGRQITRDGRDDQPEDHQPYPWLRVSIDVDDGHAAAVIDPAQARHLAEHLGAWADSTQGQRSAAGRIPLDHLTSDQYDQLCDDLDRYRRAADPELQQRLEAAIRALGKSETELAQLRADIAACREQQWPQRLGQAEKALSRARAECDRIEAAVRANPQSPDFDGAYLAALGHILAALDEPKEPTP